MAVPYTFGTATSSIPLSQLDSNFNTVITLGNTAIQLGNTVTTLNNMTLANVTISSGNVTITNVAITTANVTTANITTAVIGTETVTTSTITTGNVTTANITTGNITNGTVITSLTLSYGTANGVAYLNGSKVLTTGSAFVFDGTNVGIGTSSPQSSLQVAGTLGSAPTGAGVHMGITSTFASIQLNGDASTGSIIDFSTSGTDYLGRILYNNASNYLSFSTNNTERMRIDSSGNLGIGTTSPSAKVQIAGGSIQLDTSTSVAFGNINTRIQGASDGSFIWYGSGTERMRIDTSGNLLVGTTSWDSTNKLQVAGRIGATGFANTVGSYAALTASIQQGYPSYGFAQYLVVENAVNNSYGMAIYTTSVGTQAERMRIDSSGNLLVNRITQFSNGQYSADFGGNSSRGATYNNTDANTGANFVSFGSSGTVIGTISQVGTTAVLYNTSSDQRLKENIQDAESASALIDSLQVRQFDWKSDNSHQRYGFVAQELVTVAPEAVHQPINEEEMMAVDYSKLVPMLVKEIQSLRKRLADAGIA